MKPMKRIRGPVMRHAAVGLGAGYGLVIVGIYLVAAGQLPYQALLPVCAAAVGLTRLACKG